MEHFVCADSQGMSVMPSEPEFVELLFCSYRSMCMDNFSVLLILRLQATMYLSGIEWP